MKHPIIIWASCLCAVVGIALVLWLLNLPGGRGSDCPGGEVEYFTPQPDITAYQVARVMAAVTLLGKAMVCVTAEHPLPEEFVKHFSPVPGQNSKPDAKP
jgi:hypothetical protein